MMTIQYQSWTLSIMCAALISIATSAPDRAGLQVLDEQRTNLAFP